VGYHKVGEPALGEQRLGSDEDRLADVAVLCLRTL
jgi:hypothetical protein